jgi:hypothetical protein
VVERREQARNGHHQLTNRTEYCAGPIARQLT